MSNWPKSAVTFQKSTTPYRSTLVLILEGLCNALDSIAHIALLVTATRYLNSTSRSILVNFSFWNVLITFYNTSLEIQHNRTNRSLPSCTFFEKLRKIIFSFWKDCSLCLLSLAHIYWVLLTVSNNLEAYFMFPRRTESPAYSLSCFSCHSKSPASFLFQVFPVSLSPLPLSSFISFLSLLVPCLSSLSCFFVSPPLSCLF